MENFFNSDSNLFFDSRLLVSYQMEETDFKHDLNNINNEVWFGFDQNVKKIKIKKDLNFLKNANIINQNKKLLSFFKNCLINYNYYIKNKIIKNLIVKNFNLKRNYKLFNLLNLYYGLNYNKLKKINELNYFSSLENLIIIVDIRFSKPRIFLINKNRCFYSITSGIIYKKLNLKQKKIKKTEKMLNLMLKAFFLKIKRVFLKKKIIIHIKGTKSNIFNIIILIEKQLKQFNTSFIYSPHISYGKFKFKKLKSIKKRLRKKFSKLLKN